ncbi:MAG: hypothetical protein HKO66_11275 [Saprospiraceae bacterium]|nr:hypothetical protein [Bacteroidia bacterium]NNE14013.1 hypothetical protein [Saprospiraceae bacterium]NNL92807.1 hypothetical protein [Saprospiraceae bacterium]
MKILFLKFTGIICLILCLNACGDSIDCDDTTTLNAEAEMHIDAIFDAQDAFNNDQSDDNCKTLKSVLEDYLDFLGEYEECVDAEDLDEYNATIAEGEAFLSSLNC